MLCAVTRQNNGQSVINTQNQVHRNKSCHIRNVLCVTNRNEAYHKYEWVMSHVGINHVTHRNESRDKSHAFALKHTVCSVLQCVAVCCIPVLQHIGMSHVTQINHSPSKPGTEEWVTPHMRMRHVIQRNKSRHTYEWVTQHMGLCHVIHRDESCHTYEWGTLHMRMSHVTHRNESCHTCEWVMSHVGMSYVTHLSESRHTWECVMSRIGTNHVTHRNESCHSFISA